MSKAKLVKTKAGIKADCWIFAVVFRDRTNQLRECTCIVCSLWSVSPPVERVKHKRAGVKHTKTVLAVYSETLREDFVLGARSTVR